MPLAINIPPAELADICHRWKVRELALFGSVITDEFRPDSDVDVLVVFEEGAGWSLFDVIEMREELSVLFGREVDVVEKDAIRNPFRRHHILTHHEVVYAS